MRRVTQTGGLRGRRVGPLVGSAVLGATAGATPRLILQRQRLFRCFRGTRKPRNGSAPVSAVTKGQRAGTVRWVT